jgi:hypothetical protein
MDTNTAAAQPTHVAIPTVEYMSHKFLHWGYDCADESAYANERAAVLAPIAAAYYIGGPEAVIKAASGSNHGDVVRAWELAMNAVYGPLRIHESYKDSNDRPTAECLAKFPDVAAYLARAAAQLVTHLAV